MRRLDDFHVGINLRQGWEKVTGLEECRGEVDPASHCLELSTININLREL